MLRTNILANLAGSGWIAVLTLIATPIQIHLLGVEAYGLIGLITVLQIVFNTLDLGLSASVTQTVAADRSPGRAESAPLTNSVGTIYGLMAILIAGLLWLTASLIATRWLKPDTLDSETVLAAVRAIGLYVAFRWPISFYTGVLSGIQRMDVLNLLKAGAATVRLGVGIAVILAWPDIVLFLAWFAASALVELVAFAIATHRLVPELRPMVRISWPAIRSVWKFSATMAAIAVLSMLITQMDRIFVSKLLSLEAFGYYSLAYTTGIAISLLQVSLNNAALPAFAEAASHGRRELAQRYAKVSELTAFAVALPCALLVFFGADILRVWVNEEAARGAGLPLALLSFGFFLNAAFSNAYLSAVATRKANIPATVNAIGILVYAPALYVLTARFGTVGAASGWVLLTVYYGFTLFPAVHRRVLHVPLLPSLWHGLAAPVLSAVLAVGGMRLAANILGSEYAIWIALALAIPFYALGGYLLTSTPLREAIRRSGALAVIQPTRGAAR